MTLEFIYTYKDNGWAFVGFPEGYEGEVGHDYVPQDLIYPTETVFSKALQTKKCPKILSHTVWEKCNILAYIIPQHSDRSGPTGSCVAHYMVFQPDEHKPLAGPAWMLRHRSWVTNYNEKKGIVPYAETVVDLKNNYCPQTGLIPKEWESVKEILLSSLEEKRKIVLLFNPKNEEHSSKNLLNLFYEVLSNVDETKRWDTTFGTFASHDKHHSMNWDWTCVVENDTDSRNCFTNELNEDQIVYLSKIDLNPSV